MKNTMAEEIKVLPLSLLKVLFRDYSPSAEVKLHVEKGSTNLNENVVFHLIYYLLKIIDIEQSIECLTSCWPLTCSKTRAQFRMGVKKIVTWINKEYPEARLSFLPSMLQVINLKRLSEFLFKLTLFAVKVHMRRNHLESVMNIPELGRTKLTIEEKLLIYKNKAVLRKSSFITLQKKIEEQAQFKKNCLLNFEKESIKLDETQAQLSDISINLISTFPDKYQSALTSDNWKSEINEWCEEIDELSENNKLKIKLVEQLVPQFCNFFDLVNSFEISNTFIDANEISSYDRSMFEIASMKDSQDSFNGSKFTSSRPLSLLQVLQSCTSTSLETLRLFENISASNLLNFEKEVLTILDDSEILRDTIFFQYEKMVNLKRDLLHGNIVMENFLKEKSDVHKKRKLSNFFESPLLIITNEGTESPVLSSPGLTGAQCLEGMKKQLKFKNEELKYGATVNRFTVENCTPTSSKCSQIPRFVKNKVISNSNMEYSSKHEKKEGWEAPIMTNCITYPKAVVLSSTLCSESSKKNLGVPVGNLVEESLSPILNSSRQMGMDLDFNSTDRDSDDFSPSSMMVSKTSEPPGKLRKKSRPSLDNIIERYKNFVKTIQRNDD